MSTYRTGNHWGVTIVAEGDGARCGRPDHDCERGHLVAVVVDGGEELAERICALLNENVGGCSAVLPGLFDGGETGTFCELRHGHVGTHEAGPTRWTVRP